jgi:hypothetical protein
MSLQNSKWSSDDSIPADLASSREQLINEQRKFLSRIKNRPEPNKRDAFLTWIMQAVAGHNKTRWRRFQNDVKQLVCRYADVQSSLDLTFP